MRRALRVIARSVGGLWSMAMLLLMVSSLALSVAMTLVPAVFSAVAGVVGAATGARTVQARHAADLAAERGARRAAVSRADDLALQLADSRAAQARLARELADAPVTYRGARVAAREAVSDTAARVSRRVAAASARNLGSIAGEALPVVGIGVVVAATAWELADSCALMGEMRALDAAFNPHSPVSDREVCGFAPPTRDEVWAEIKASPAAAWDRAAALYDGLPSPDFGRLTGSALRGYDALYGYLLGAPE